LTEPRQVERTNTYLLVDTHTARRVTRVQLHDSAHQHGDYHEIRRYKKRNK